MTRALVIGESHSNAIAQAIATLAPDYDDIVVHRLASRRESNEHAATSEAAVKLVSEQPPGIPVFLALLGTYHNIVGLIRSGPEFDFMLDENDVPPAGADCVRLPYQAIAGLFTDHLAKAGSIRRLRDAARSSVYVLSSPPPKHSNEFMTQKFMRKQNRAYRGRDVMQAGIARPDIRVKLWRLEARLLELWAVSEGMQFIPAPVASFNEDGFLSRKYYFEDATHANARYGALVLDQIAEITAHSIEEVRNG